MKTQAKILLFAATAALLPIVGPATAAHAEVDCSITANNDTFTTTEGVTVSQLPEIFANDYQTGCGEDTLEEMLASYSAGWGSSSPSHGHLDSGYPNGDYVPDPGYVGDDTWTYYLGHVVDGEFIYDDSATVTVHILAAQQQGSTTTLHKSTSTSTSSTTIGEGDPETTTTTADEVLGSTSIKGATTTTTAGSKVLAENQLASTGLDPDLLPVGAAFVAAGITGIGAARRRIRRRR